MASNWADPTQQRDQRLPDENAKHADAVKWNRPHRERSHKWRGKPR